MANLCAVVFRVVVYAVFAQTLTYVVNADVAAESRRWGTAAHLLGAVGCHTDRIQEAALREGAYFSGDVPRLYNTIEARACSRGKRVVFAGDSHSKQLFIGLVDVLQGEPSNVEIHSSRERNMHLEVAEATAASFLQLMGIHVSWNCSGARLPRGSCYGSTGDLDACRQCLNEINATFKVLSTTVHLVMTRVKAEFAKEKQLASETIKDANENKKSACTTCCSCWSNASFEQGMVHDVVREISTTYLSVRGLVWGSGVSSSKDIIPMPYVAGLTIACILLARARSDFKHATADMPLTLRASSLVQRQHMQPANKPTRAMLTVHLVLRGHPESFNCTLVVHGRNVQTH